LVKTTATIRHGFDGAFYAPDRDEVCLPNRDRFTTEVNYYATALHELGHNAASRFMPRQMANALRSLTVRRCNAA
jgi:antirestriction protein ArdC